MAGDLRTPAGSAWTAATFEELVDPYRRELLVHCYRMLGSLDDAEDAVQDALTRAWAGRDTFVRPTSIRAWLYRIATNACLDAIDRRRREARGPGTAAVVPAPDEILLRIAAPDAGPEARYTERESVSLAFLTVLQILPPRQRAVLLLRDVLAMRATEVASLVDLSVPAVNSALQRARVTVRARHRPEAVGTSGAGATAPHLRTLLDRYVRAWEAADIAGLVGLLRDDAVLAMPPIPSVVGGRAIGAFLAEAILVGAGPHRLVAAAANGQPAFAAYVRTGSGPRLGLFSLLVLSTDGRRVTRIDAFKDRRAIGRFGLANELPI